MAFAFSFIRTSAKKRIKTIIEHADGCTRGLDCFDRTRPDLEAQEFELFELRTVRDDLQHNPPPAAQDAVGGRPARDHETVV